MKQTLTRDAFLGLSAELTGYTPEELEGTGLIDTYHELLCDILGPNVTSNFAEVIAHVLITKADTPERAQAVQANLQPPSVYWPVNYGLTWLWYMGSWNQLPDNWYATMELPIPGPLSPGRTHVPSQLAYTEQLSFRTARAHAPGANPTGFGSWTFPPL